MQINRISTTACVSFLLAVFALMLSAERALAQVPLQVVAHSGQPFDINRVFVSFDHGVINDQGHVMFLGRTAIDTPANDECSGAIEIFPGITSLGNDFATSTATPAWCGVLDSWYRFVVPGPTPSTVNLQVICGHPAHNIQLYSGSCGSLTPIGSCMTGIFFSGNLTVGQTYYVRIGSRLQPPPHSPTGVTSFIFRRESIRADTLPTWDNYLFINRGTGNVPVLHEGDITSFDPTLVYRGMSFAGLSGGDEMAVPATARTSAPAEPTGVSLVTGAVDGPFYSGTSRHRISHAGTGQYLARAGAATDH
jgi:hypothetical protein